MLDDLTLGRFEPGHSFFHRFDIHLKLIVLPLLVISSFATARPPALLSLTLVAVFYAGLSRLPWRIWWRGLLVFRWLFFFTLLMHLFFSPGRTLFGVSYLSYDGLLAGLVVIWQLSLAIIFSSLLTLTASPAALAQALASLCAPFKRLRRAADQAATFLLLILHFIPLLREELVVARGASALQPASFMGRVRLLRDQISQVLVRLTDRGDELAHHLARGESLESLGLAMNERFMAPSLSRAQNAVIFSLGMLVSLALLGARLWPIFV